MITGIYVTIEGSKVVVNGLTNLFLNIQKKAIPRGLRRIVKGSATEALQLLSGPKRGLKTVTAKKSGRQRAVAQKPELAGGYPVPRMAGFLRRALDWLFPGQSKSANGLSFSAGPMEGLLYNSALYAGQIHEGKGSSSRYGPRPFLDDAFKAFNQGGGAAKAMEEEIAKEVKSSGLG